MNISPGNVISFESLERQKYERERKGYLKEISAEVAGSIMEHNNYFLHHVERDCQTYSELFKLLSWIRHPALSYREKLDEHCNLLVCNLKENGRKYDALSHLHMICFLNEFKQNGYMTVQDYEAQEKGWI